MSFEPINVFDYQARAEQVLHKDHWDFIDAGDFDELTVRRNRTAFDAISLRPKFMVDVQNRDLSTTVLGQKINFPVLLAPCAGQGRCHDEAEKGAASGATSLGTIYCINFNSRYSIEEVMQTAGGPLWFQLYHQTTAGTESMVRRAEDAGYSALCVTVDVPFPTRKERDIRNAYRPGGDPGTRSPAGAIRHLEWDPPIQWKDIEWLRSLTKMPIIIKGLRTAEDARLCVEHGVEAVYVSNHGGRQVDGTLSAIETLPEVVDAVNGQAEIYLDSGVRRGADVLRALALGADAVFVGRPFLWGLAVNGKEGVREVLAFLRDELDRAMGFCGLTSIDQINRSVVSLPGEAGWIQGAY